MAEAVGKNARAVVSELTEGSVVRAAWYQSWPMTVAQFAGAAYTLVDMFFVGKLGRDAIAGVALGGIVDNVGWIMMTGLVISTKVYIARDVGAGRRRQAAHSTYQAFLLGFVLSLVVTLPCFFLARQILELLGGRGKVITDGLGFLQILSLGLLVTFQMQVARSVFDAVGDPKIPMRILILSNILNAVLNPLLIWGWGPIPAFGVNGSALATVLGRIFGLAWFLVLILKTGLVERSAWRQKPDYALMYRFLRLGSPRSLQRGLEVLSETLLLRIVADHGTAALAAYGIGLRIDLAMKTPGWGLGSSVITLVGQNMGAGKLERAEKSVWMVTLMYLSFAALCGLAFFFAPRAVMGAFSRDPGVLRLGAQYLRFMSFGYLFMATAFILDRGLAGAGDTVTPMAVSIACLIVLQISLALTVPRLTGLGVEGIWVAILVTYAVWAATLLHFYRRGRWKHKMP